MPLTETLAVTCRVAAIFEELGIPCVIGGSVASSLHGIPRATQDVDVVVNLAASQFKPGTFLPCSLIWSLSLRALSHKVFRHFLLSSP